MTKTTIDPVVSTNPELTAEITQYIAEWKEALKKWNTDLKNLGNASGKKAERKAIKDRIAICETTIAGFTAKLPPTYVDPVLAAERVREAAKGLDRLEARKAEFIESFNANPQHAIEWRAGDVVQAQTVAKYVHDLSRLLEPKAIAEMPAVLRDFIAQVTKDLVSGTRDSHSTSPFDNVCEKMVQAARAGLVSDFSGLQSVLFEAERWAERVTATAGVRLSGLGPAEMSTQDLLAERERLDRAETVISRNEGW